MALHNPMGLITLRADGDYRLKQYCVVTAGDANGDFALAGAGAVGVRPIGILQNKPNTGEFGTIATAGISKVLMKENCSRQAIVVGDDAAGGQGEVADADKEIGVGIALEANANGDGGYVGVLIVPGISHHQ